MNLKSGLEIAIKYLLTLNPLYKVSSVGVVIDTANDLVISNGAALRFFYGTLYSDSTAVNTIVKVPTIAQPLTGLDVPCFTIADNTVFTGLIKQISQYDNGYYFEGYYIQLALM